MGVTALNVERVNVLRWNERLKNIQESHGLFLVRFNNKTRKNREEGDSGGDCCVSVFETQNLSAPDSTEWVVSMAMQTSLKFLSDQEDTTTTRTRNRLTTAISAYLFRYFLLNHDDDEEHKPKIVIVVELPLSIMTKNCYVGEDSRLKIDRHPEAKSSLRFLCVSGRFRDQEVKEIRGILLMLLREPIVLWVRPVSYKPTGLYEVEKLLNGNSQPQDNYSAS